MAFVVINFLYNNGNNLRYLMMNLQDIMVKLAEYSVGCRIMDGYFLINITYDDNWNVIPPENEKIEFAQKNGISYYMAMINDVSFEEVFNSIQETIDYNIDLQKKVNLFKAKVDELQELFAKEDLETLRTITFEYTPKKKEKRKYVKKKEKEKEITNSDMNEGKNENIDNKPSEVETIKEEKPIVVETKDETTKEECNDGVVYEEYNGEETTQTVNKIDYIEQLKG